MNQILVDIDNYIKDCPPYDNEIDEAALAGLSEEIARRFDSTEIYGQIDRLCCQILRERGIEPSTGLES
jgi:hypothetical protein